MSGDGSPWRSGAAEFDDVGFSLVKRDIEVLMLAVQNLTASLQNVGVDSATVRNLFTEFVDGRIPWTVPEGGTGAQALTGYVVGSGAGALSATATIPWADLTDVPSTFPPAGAVTVNTNTSDTTDAAALTISGTFAAQTWTLYEKRPRFNAKWIQGTVVSSTAPSNKYQLMKYDLGLNLWGPWDMAGATPRTGDVLCTNTADASGYSLTQAGLAQSVFCNATATNGLPAPLQAGTADTVLGRRGTVLTWAKVALAEIADLAGISLLGRSANSTGVTAAITGAANQVLACNGTPALAFSRTITLGDTSNAGSLTIGNATSATAIVLSPTLINAAGKVMSVREIDVCDAGVAKKMLVLASAPY